MALAVALIGLAFQFLRRDVQMVRQTLVRYGDSQAAVSFRPRALLGC